MSRTRDSGNAQEWIISNEFAQVRLTIDRRGNDPRLRIEDMTTDVSVAFDAFMLAGLTTASAEDLARHMDPDPKVHRGDA
jgi:hypothetical protein